MPVHESLRILSHKMITISGTFQISQWSHAGLLL